MNVLSIENEAALAISEYDFIDLGLPGYKGFDLSGEAVIRGHPADDDSNADPVNRTIRYANSQQP